MRLQTRGFLWIKRQTLPALFPMLAIDMVRVPDRSGSLGSATLRASGSKPGGGLPVRHAADLLLRRRVACRPGRVDGPNGPRVS